ncbi:glycosyl hydrolase family protein [Flammeovirga pectinis]|uniref:Glycosyl hydrolase family protein n=1 Tax=Flammeovirga pectinis TaxID=2494373 RepID=A0A3Q9FNU4_9BACT|nr:family 16 glycosylhydrolase [Flammeovirga pectinis]AZQ63771.1 glycosyl hydrolase family protein [Flammeovirga pectinis]
MTKQIKLRPHIIILLLSNFIGLIVLAQKPLATTKSNDKWEIQWSASDEFNAENPDWKKWMQNGKLPNTTAWKWDNDSNVTIKDGIAKITMRPNYNNEEDKNTYFKSGILKSYRAFTYGYFEARIKGASLAEGVCPSFWLFSDFDKEAKDGEPVYCEIDVVELQQFDWYNKHQEDIQDIDLNLHAVIKVDGKREWHRPKKYPEEQLNKWRAPWNPSEDYHVYGCEVNKKEIIWFIDGVEVARKKNIYWHRPMNVTLSLGLRKPFVKFYNNRNNAIDPTTDEKTRKALDQMPTSMFVDYVRVWKKK